MSVGGPAPRPSPPMDLQMAPSGNPAGYLSPQPNHRGLLMTRGGSGERNLLKLLHAGGGPATVPPEDAPPSRPPGQ